MFEDVLKDIKPSQKNAPVYSGIIGALLSGLAGAAGGQGVGQSLIQAAAGGAEGYGTGVELPREIEKEDLTKQRIESQLASEKSLEEYRKGMVEDRKLLHSSIIGQRVFKKQQQDEATDRWEMVKKKQLDMHQKYDDWKASKAKGIDAPEPEAPMFTKQDLDTLGMMADSKEREKTVLQMASAMSAEKRQKAIIESAEKRQDSRIVSQPYVDEVSKKMVLTHGNGKVTLVDLAELGLSGTLTKPGTPAKPGFEWIKQPDGTYKEVPRGQAPAGAIPLPVALKTTPPGKAPSATPKAEVSMWKLNPDGDSFAHESVSPFDVADKAGEGFLTDKQISGIPRMGRKFAKWQKTQATGKGPAATSEPTTDWMARARKANPGASDEALKKLWNEKKK